jgi:UDP-glucose 4-epimerase
MKILLTGGTGTIGKELLPTLLVSGHKVVSLSRRDPGFFHPALFWIACDLSILAVDSNGVQYPSSKSIEILLIEKLKDVDCILHLAGLPSGEGSTLEEYIQSNVVPTQNLLKLATLQKVKIFIFCSTASVYGSNSSKEPSLETDPLKGNTHYAISKIEAEKLILQSEIPNTIIFRISSVYGKNSKSYINKLIKLYSKSLFPYPLKKNIGKSFIYIEDLISFFQHALNYEGSGIYNIAHPQKVSVPILLKLFKKVLPKIVFVVPIPSFLIIMDELFSKFSSIRSRESALRPLFQKSLLNPNKAIQELGYTPQTDMEKGLKSLLLEK